MSIIRMLGNFFIAVRVFIARRHEFLMSVLALVAILTAGYLALLLFYAFS